MHGTALPSASNSSPFTLISDSPALAALRHATHQIHLELERDLHIAAASAGKKEYMAYVAALWGWLHGFERELWNGLWPSEIRASARAGKSDWLLADLRAGGLSDASLEQLPVSGFRPDMTSMAARFGIAYVIEGAQLGTQVLRKRIGPALAPWPTRWLEGYGADTAANWRSFVACAGHALDSEDSRAVAAHAARETFASLAAWFRMQSAA